MHRLLECQIVNFTLLLAGLRGTLSHWGDEINRVTISDSGRNL
jgi:hypothetical protein